MQVPVDAGHGVPQLSHAAQLTIRTRVTENAQILILIWYMYEYKSITTLDFIPLIE